MKTTRQNSAATSDRRPVFLTFDDTPLALPRVLLLSVVLACAVLLSACGAIGPGTIPRDRINYNQAISDSWQEQTLLNIVKLRYADMPLFVEVASVISGYNLERSVNLAASGTSNDAGSANTGVIGGEARLTDRPTITYSPITGRKFNQSFMVPIPPHIVMFLTQSGWPVDLVFPLTVESINGLRSESAAADRLSAGDPGYYRVMELFDRVQRAGGSGMQIIRDDEDGNSSNLVFHSDALPDDQKKAISELTGELQLRPGLDSYRVKYDFAHDDDTEIAVLTRSMLQVILMLSYQVDVPDEHVASGQAISSSYEAGANAGRRIIDIRSSVDEPEDAFVSVYYNGYWFWISKSDYGSKRVFSFVMILLSLAEDGESARLPLVTVPAN